MNQNEYIQKQIEDKIEKNKIYTTFFNFYWALNLTGITIFKDKIANIQTALLFVILTIGAIITTIFIIDFNTRKAKLINELIKNDDRERPELFSKFHEKVWSYMYLVSFIVLLLFWINLLITQILE